MATFEFKTEFEKPAADQIEAAKYQLQPAGSTLILTFLDDQEKQIASFVIGGGAYVKKVKG